MNHRLERSIAFVLCLLVALGTTVPYLIADNLANPHEFAGFLVNPIDGFSYLAKMRQGAEGRWLFHLAYASDPGPDAFLFGYYNLLGHVADFLDRSLIEVFHFARVVAVLLMYWLVYRFCEKFLVGKFERWAAFLLSLLGAGLGWFFLAFDIQASDLSIPESVPFLAGYTNAHFPLTNALLIGAVISTVSDGGLRARVLVAWICGLLMGIVLPFSLASTFTLLFLWLLWESMIVLRQRDWRAVWMQNRERFAPLLAFLLGAGPLLIYGFWLTQNHPVLSVWTAQNKTPSPPVHEYIVGYSPVLLLAIAAGLRKETRCSPHGRLLLAWAISNLLLLYAPLNLQRRLTLGLYFPLACLAAIALRNLVSNPGRRRFVLIMILIISLPSNLVIIAAGLDGVRNSDPSVIHLRGELAAYSWLADHVPEDSLVLAAPDTGNRIPAFANVSVLYGHPFETPNAEQQEALVNDLFAWQGDGSAGIDKLISLGVEFVYYGSRESKIGSPTWLSRCAPIYEAQEVQIFQVIDR